MSNKTIVWDIPTRLCHWLLVASIFYAWLSIEILEDMEQHFIAGYSVLTLILFRLIWGFIGSRYSRFSSFLFSPKEVMAYSKTLNDKESQPFSGHNPLGSMSAFLMLFIIALQALSGLFNTDDYFFGALNYLVSDSLENNFHLIHEWNFEVIVVVIAVHILAIVFYQIYKKQRLTAAMIHGKKSIFEEINNEQTKQTSKLLLATVVFALCAGSVYLLATQLPEPSASEDFYY